MAVANNSGMKVRLIRKLAQLMNGVDVSNHEVGDIIDLPPRKGRMLVAEGWAIADRRVGGPSRVLAFRRDSDLGHRHDGEEDVTRAS
jgi:hypothetical protein